MNSDRLKIPDNQAEPEQRGYWIRSGFYSILHSKKYELQGVAFDLWPELQQLYQPT